MYIYIYIYIHVHVHVGASLRTELSSASETCFTSSSRSFAAPAASRCVLHRYRILLRTRLVELYSSTTALSDTLQYSWSTRAVHLVPMHAYCGRLGMAVNSILAHDLPVIELSGRLCANISQWKWGTPKRPQYACIGGEYIGTRSSTSTSHCHTCSHSRDL